MSSRREKDSGQEREKEEKPEERTRKMRKERNKGRTTKSDVPVAKRRKIDIRNNC